MKILVLNGPNLNMLGQREPDVYGSITLEGIIEMVKTRAAELDVEVDFFQSNEEGALVTKIHEASGAYDGILFNPAAYTHTSVALHDAVKSVDTPCVEVHISNVHAREEFRHKSLIVGACVGQVLGFGATSYVLALEGMIDYLRRRV
ncbi:type II 3-dehydroquinate dehydratase [bacterium E08(2017)]|nr:type II 3-dehydroquinate dehydratase [bacterium E08(2017)]